MLPDKTKCYELKAVIYIIAEHCNSLNIFNKIVNACTISTKKIKFYNSIFERKNNLKFLELKFILILLNPVLLIMFISIFIDTVKS